MSSVVLDQSNAMGRLVAAGRMLAGLDQVGLAALAGVSASTISNIERGQESREDTLKAIRKALRSCGVVNSHDKTNGSILLSLSYDEPDEED